MNVLARYASNGEYGVHDFVILPDHLHLLITPAAALERTAQFVKGGFSFQAKRAFDWKGDIWQTGYSDHRIRDEADYREHIVYVEKNVASLKREDYVFCGRAGRLPLEPAPPWLKPL